MNVNDYLPTPTPVPPPAPIYPRNGASGICRCGEKVTYIGGTNGPGTWYHKSPWQACPTA